jgi:hypothetical protein
MYIVLAPGDGICPHVVAHSLSTHFHHHRHQHSHSPGMPRRHRYIKNPETGLYIFRQQTEIFFLVERAGNLSPSFVIDLVTLYFTIYAIIKVFLPGFRIRIHLIRIQIQHFRLNTGPIKDVQVAEEAFSSQKRTFSTSKHDIS